MYTKINSLPDYEININGIIRKISNKRIKSQYISSNGYYMISARNEVKSKPYRVHRLLAETFIPNLENKPHVNHKDGNKLNNNITNLEWVTHKENMQHAFKNGLANNTGEKNGMSKLTIEEVAIIKRMLLDGVSQQKIANHIGNISRSAILNIKIRNQWKDVEPAAKAAG
jgi:hypothetical protein